MLPLRLPSCCGCLLGSVLLIQTAFYIQCQGVNNGPIRLWKNNTTSLAFTQGRVQVLIGGQWGNICGVGGFDITEAHVICHQLGYTAAVGHSSAGSDGYGADPLPAVLHSVSCSTSQYLVILQCSHSTATSPSCTDDDDVSVTCYNTRIWDNPFPLQVRLTQGSTVNQGLVEVYCSGQWGTVCDDSFSQNDANTVCRQLGYNAANLSTSLSNFTINPSQPIWFTGFGCQSQYQCIRECLQCPSLQVSTCNHSNDVILECYTNLQDDSNDINNETCQPSATTTPFSIEHRISIAAIVGSCVGGILILVGVVIAIAYSLWETRQPSHPKMCSKSTEQATDRLVSRMVPPDHGGSLRNFPKPRPMVNEAVPAVGSQSSL